MADIAIVGGGVTGLSAGIHLLRACGTQHRVTVYEAHRIPGGNLTGWDRDGYHIDNCLHWLTGTNPTTAAYRTWCDLGVLGEHVEVRRLPSLLTCRMGEQSLSLYRDLNRTRADMLDLSPEDGREIHRFFCTVEALQGICGIAGGAHNQRIGRLYASLFWPDLLRYHRMSTGELAQRFRHPLIRRFMTSVGGDDFAASAMLAVVAHFCGGNADLPSGGSRAMARRMADTFTSLGGRLLTGCDVRHIHLAGTGRARRAVSVVLHGGGTHPADCVVVTADPRTVCGRILDAPLPRALERKYRDPRPLRFSGLHAAFTVPENALTFSGDLVLPLPADAREALGGGQVILREFSHEPTFSPGGAEQCIVVQATVFCPEDVANAYITLAGDRPAYLQKKEAIAGHLGRILEEACPAAAGQIRRLDVWTPATYRRFTGSEIGSFMGFILRPGDNLRRIDGRLPGLSNVRLAGQWLHAPGGLPIAADEGRRVAEEVRRYLSGLPEEVGHSVPAMDEIRARS